MEGLRIARGGKLIETYWHYDDSTEQGEYKERDITDKAIRNLFNYCDLEEGVTLKDIFLLLNSELDIFDAVLGNWCKEIVTEGLTQPEKPYDISHDEAIEYLELYFYMESDKHKHNEEHLLGTAFPQLGGVGVERKQDSYFDWNDKDGNPAIEWKKGERTPWGVSMTPTNELINIPIKLNRSCTIYRTDYTKFHIVKSEDGSFISGKSYWEEGADQDKEIAKLDHIQFTLGQILYGFVWELSFHGDPGKRDNFVQELSDIVSTIKKEDY